MPVFTFFRSTLVVLILFIAWTNVARSQQAVPLDSLIMRIPSMMRSNETAAREMITELARRSDIERHHHGVVQSAFFKAWLLYRHAPPDVAIASIDSALENIPGLANDTALVKFYILKGQCYVKKTAFGSALHEFNKALDIANKRNDKGSRTSTMISIGWAYMEDAKPREAIRFFNEVLQLEPAADYPHRAVLLCNIAACYNTIGDFRHAERYAQLGIAAARRKGSTTDLANGLNILGRSYYQQGRMSIAIETLKEASIAREAVADPSMLASDYLELADLYNKNSQPHEAIAWARKAESVSMKSRNSLKVAATYETLADAYEAVGNHRNAVSYMRKLLAHKDSLSNDRYSQAFAEMQVKFETQKKNAENLQLKKDNLEARLQYSNQQRWLVALVAGVILLTASVIYIPKLLKSRYRTRLALEQVREQKQRTLAVMEAEEKERRRIAGDLHDGVGQTLAAAALQLTKARKEPAALDKVEELLHQAGSEARDLSHQVTPVLFKHYGLAKAMQQDIDRLNDSTDTIDLTLYTHIEQEVEDEMVALTVYRCFQELVSNILKHSGATEATIQLSVDGEELLLIAEDNGVGFVAAEEDKGLGLKNMESRAALYDGELRIDSTPGKGTTTILCLQRKTWQRGVPKTMNL